MNEAEQLAGLPLRVPVEQLARLPEDTFYHHDLVGCQVMTQDGQNVGMVKASKGRLKAAGLS